MKMCIPSIMTAYNTTTLERQLWVSNLKLRKTLTVMQKYSNDKLNCNSR